MESSHRDTVSFVRSPETLIEEVSSSTAISFDLHQRIWETLLSDPKLVYHLLKSQKTNALRLTSCVLQACEGRALSLCAKLIELEGAATGASATTFLRGNSAATRVATTIARRKAAVFLNLVLRDSVMEVLCLKTPLDQNPELVQRLCSDILFRFEQHFDRITDVVRTICSFVLNAASSFPEEMRFKLVGGFFLLRLVNPALQDPGLIAGFDAVELDDGDSGVVCRKNLTLLASVLQHVSNEQAVKALPSLDAWVRRAACQLDRLFRRAAVAPGAPRGVAPACARSWNLAGAGRAAAKALSAEDAAFVLECFVGSRGELEARARGDESVFALDSFGRLLEEAARAEESAEEKREPARPPGVWVEVLPANSAGKRTLRGRLFGAREAGRRAHARVEGRAVALFAGAEESAARLRSNNNSSNSNNSNCSNNSSNSSSVLALSELRGCYARPEEALLELETPSESWALRFRDAPALLPVWCAALNDWISFLHSSSSSSSSSALPAAAKDKKPDGLKGYLEKEGCRRWFYQVGSRLYYFEDVFSSSLGFVELAEVVAMDFGLPGEAFVLHLRGGGEEEEEEGRRHQISMLDDAEPAPSSLRFVADSAASRLYWQRGLARACPAARAAAAVVVAPELSASSSFASLPRALCDSDVAPPPQMAALCSWIKNWTAKISDTQRETCDLVLFAPGKDIAVGVAAVVKNGPSGCLYAEHVGGALLEMLGSFETKCVPSVVGRDVGRVLAGTAEGSSERAAALALVLYSLPFQHRALFVALLKNVVTPVAGTSSSRLDRLSRFLAPLLFDGLSVEDGAAALSGISRSGPDALNARAQIGVWKPGLPSHKLCSAPSHVLVMLASHPIFQQVDEEGARALLLGHARLGAPPQLLAALCQIYAVNGGAAKRAPNFRAENVTEWRRERLAGVVWLVSQWMLVCPELFLIEPCPLLQPLLDVMAPAGANTADMFDFERAFLLDFRPCFLRALSRPDSNSGAAWLELGNVALRGASKAVMRGPVVRDDVVAYNTPKLRARTRPVVRDPAREEAPEHTPLWSHSPDVIAEVLAAVDVGLLAGCSISSLGPLLARERWYGRFALGWLLRYAKGNDLADAVVCFVYLVRLAKFLRRAKSYLGAYALANVLHEVEVLELPVPSDILSRSRRLYEFFANGSFRVEMNLRSLPVVPVASVIEKDLASEPLPSTVPAPRESGSNKDWVNLDALRQRWANERAGFERFQGAALLTKKSPIEEHPGLLAIIENVVLKDESDLAACVEERKKAN